MLAKAIDKHGLSGPQPEHREDHEQVFAQIIWQVPAGAIFDTDQQMGGVGNRCDKDQVEKKLQPGNLFFNHLFFFSFFFHGFSNCIGTQ